MNLVDKKESLNKDLKTLVDKRNELLNNLKELELAIASYQGAISYNDSLIKEQELESQDKVIEPTETKDEE